MQSKIHRIKYHSKSPITCIFIELHIYAHFVYFKTKNMATEQASMYSSLRYQVMSEILYIREDLLNISSRNNYILNLDIGERNKLFSFLNTF